VYVEFLERYRDRFGHVVGAIASADVEGAVVFYCMAGKDRTGLHRRPVASRSRASSAGQSPRDYALSGRT
jgi:protein tyrosine/serine phosphatase